MDEERLYRERFRIQGTTSSAAARWPPRSRGCSSSSRLPNDVIRRLSIANFEAEMNVVMYAQEAELELVSPGRGPRRGDRPRPRHRRHRVGDAARATPTATPRCAPAASAPASACPTSGATPTSSGSNSTVGRRHHPALRRLHPAPRTRASAGRARPSTPSSPTRPLQRRAWPACGPARPGASAYANGSRGQAGSLCIDCGACIGACQRDALRPRTSTSADLERFKHQGAPFPRWCSTGSSATTCGRGRSCTPSAPWASTRPSTSRGCARWWRRPSTPTSPSARAVAEDLDHLPGGGAADPAAVPEPLPAPAAHRVFSRQQLAKAVSALLSQTCSQIPAGSRKGTGISSRLIRQSKVPLSPAWPAAGASGASCMANAPSFFDCQSATRIGRPAGCHQTTSGCLSAVAAPVSQWRRRSCGKRRRKPIRPAAKSIRPASAMRPVEPGDLVVLAIGVVVAAPGCGRIRRRPAASARPATATASPAARAAGVRRSRGLLGRRSRPRRRSSSDWLCRAVAVVFAVGLVVLVVVADEVAQRETVVRGDEIDAGLRRAAVAWSNMSLEPADAVPRARRSPASPLSQKARTSSR